MTKRKLEQDEQVDSRTKHEFRTPKQSDRHIRRLNALPSRDFVQQYISPGWLKPQNEQQRIQGANIQFKVSSELTHHELSACLDLVATTSRQDYENSSWGWHPRRKRREMREDEMRYLLVRTTSNMQSDVQGFVSFMLTHDSSPSVPVLYVYEIHLAVHLRKLGLGAHLMQVVEDLARTLSMDKIMLTCFVRNVKAYNFYVSRGYEKDAISPEDRSTRKKTTAPDYVILSKPA
jgi:N-alpha-acetyltransferase 40